MVDEQQDSKKTITLAERRKDGITMDTIISWWLRKTVLKKANWNAPQEEIGLIQEDNTPISEPLPPWAFPSWYVTFKKSLRSNRIPPLPPWASPSWYDLPTSKRAEELPLALPQTQIREPVSFLVGFSPLPDS